MSSDRKVLRFVIGTAGHIDHGKSTLVQCLTGIDPDRLEEEKRRGMTIDLGFAHIILPDGRVVGFIDVPGHEKFVRNMVAGATAIHAVLLVVAADDSVMPQTEEHLAILKFLDIKEGMVVITKADLVDEETLELVRMDIEETVAGSFLEGKPIIPISAVKNIGMDELVIELAKLCDRLEERRETGLFRYFVQRVFSSAGFGTVLTGVTVSGNANIGDVVELMPGGQRGRIRNLQAYHSDVSSIFAGHCAAINISDLRKDELGRGMVAGTPDYLNEATNIEVLFNHVPPGSSRPLKDYSDICFHAGSMETMGKIAFMGGIKHLEAGGKAFAQLKLAESVVVWPGMRFIVRRPSPPETLGGGVVLAATGRKFRRTHPDTLSFFEHRLAALGDAEKLAQLVVSESGEQSATRVQLCSETGLLPNEIQPVIDRLLAKGTIVATGKYKYVSSTAVEDVKSRILQAITGLHAANPLSVYFEKSNLRSAGSSDDGLFDLALAALIREKKITESSAKYQMAGYKPPFSQHQQEHVVKLIAWFGESIYDAHSVNIASEICGVSAQEVEKLFAVMKQMGEIAALPDGVFLSRFAVENAEKKLREYLDKNGSIKSADFKNVIGAGRKVAIALLDHFEKSGVTFRKGGEHALRKY